MMKLHIVNCLERDQLRLSRLVMNRSCSITFSTSRFDFLYSVVLLAILTTSTHTCLSTLSWFTKL